MQSGKGSQGSQKRWFKDTLKTSLKAFGINPDTWETAAQDRTAWRSSLRKGAAANEASRKLSAEQKREARKAETKIP